MSGMSLPIALEELLASIDSKDEDRFMAFLTEDVRFRYGSGPVVEGAEAVRSAVGGVFAAFAGLRHRISDVWTKPGSLVCRGDVTYALHDGGEVTLPFVNVLGLRGDRIADYRIYIDPSPIGS